MTSIKRHIFSSDNWCSNAHCWSSVTSLFSPPGPAIAFTKANELFVGRLAQLGFAASILGEVVTGKGALAQLNIETGIPVTEIEPVFILGVLLLLLGAINPRNGRFFNDENKK